MKIYLKKGGEIQVCLKAFIIFGVGILGFALCIILLFRKKTMTTQYCLSVVLTEEEMMLYSGFSIKKGATKKRKKIKQISIISLSWFIRPISLSIVIWRHKDGVPWICKYFMSFASAGRLK
jgi:hypothetical protein